MIRKYTERELLGYLWNKIGRIRKHPKTSSLFLAIAGEAEACLHRTDWDERIRNIENLVTVIRWRMRRHWDEWHMSELDNLVLKAKKERDSHVG